VLLGSNQCGLSNLAATLALEPFEHTLGVKCRPFHVDGHANALAALSAMTIRYLAEGMARESVSPLLSETEK
jgi:hypothetical protein